MPNEEFFVIVRVKGDPKVRNQLINSLLIVYINEG
jgi:hypothetical protein